MKVRAEIEIDDETGEYEICFRNLSEPGEPMDLLRLKRAVSLVMSDWTAQREN